ncbi:tryptophan synthase subunit alpha [Actinoplanes siamensis]|uniref:Tryptophan synthase alpha chain n=1 Tax=Actinoplanes siamensis TaxID=1223317 RepID=A0A919NBP7_9ACTN|nr:tryptophan synthase subunit alpha [Actinoplanes siamensis]GIF07850.1 tryptophan synthase alpha chain [Actinoplanes siamensis]
MKRLNPYLTAGITPDWIDYLLAFQAAGADAVEIGLPFSDPMLDGATIQRASDQALRRGVTVTSILDDLTAAREHIRVPLIAMTYANLVFHGDARPGGGPEAFCRRLAAAGISGLIVPDVPVDEAGHLQASATAAGIDLVLLAAPVTPPDRLAEIGRRSKNFVYAVSIMDTTGERDALATTAAPLAERIKAVTDLPVLIGFGISTPEQAATAARSGDGVVVGAALMRRVLDGASPDDLRVEVAAFRAALDQVDQEMPDARAHTEVSGDRR